MRVRPVGGVTARLFPTEDPIAAWFKRHAAERAALPTHLRDEPGGRSRCGLKDPTPVMLARFLRPGQAVCGSCERPEVVGPAASPERGAEA